MDGKYTLCKNTSAALCHQLEDRLTAVFTNHTISKYLRIDGHGHELQILNTCDVVKMLPHFKLAFSIWTEMDARHRHQVLCRFNQLYTALPAVNEGRRKTLVFCALFVHELATVLAGTMQWPG